MSPSEFSLTPDLPVRSDIWRTDLLGEQANRPVSAEARRSDAQFIERAAGLFRDQVRGPVEEWFSRLAPDVQADVSGQLRSRQSKGACFELYLQECLLRMCSAATCQPDVDGTSRRPDFLAEERSVGHGDLGGSVWSRRPKPRRGPQCAEGLHG